MPPMHQAPSFVWDASLPSSPLAYPASQTALLILDLHNLILASKSNADEIVSKCAGVRTWATDQGIAVIHCLINFSLPTPEHYKMSGRTNGATKRVATDSSLALEHEKISAERKGDKAFQRMGGHVSALGSSPGFEEYLEEKGIKSLVLCGLSTSGCVLNTAKAAADAGYVVTVLEDACSDGDPAVHDFIMAKVLPGQCNVTSLNKLEAAWKVCYPNWRADWCTKPQNQLTVDRANNGSRYCRDEAWRSPGQAGDPVACYVYSRQHTVERSEARF